MITKSLSLKKEKLASEFKNSKDRIGYFVLDDLLPNDLALKILKNFPDTNDAISKKNFREHKYIAYQMDQYNPLLEETIYAFQDQKVVQIVEEICQLTNIYPDEHLYAGGLSIMEKGNFLNPHLDNSHDKDGNKWRVLNLLYYVTPDWEKEYGGNLELWSNGLKNSPVIITSKFNRLVLMATHQNSWHSVNKVTKEKIRRCCVSNYYFSDKPIQSTDSFHVTSFRGRPSEKVKDFILKIDTGIRSGIRKVFKKGIRENPHKYNK